MIKILKIFSTDTYLYYISVVLVSAQSHTSMLVFPDIPIKNIKKKIVPRK